jgi:glycine cleavage system aminomethyltransferase T
MVPLLEPQDPGRLVWHSPVRTRARAAGATHTHRYSHGREWARIPWDQAAYERVLDTGAMLWDLYGECGTAFRGPDARRAVDLLVTARTSDLVPGRCRYTPIADHEGVFLAGAVILVVDEREWWVANGAIDFALWADAHVRAAGLDVEVTVPDLGLLGLVGVRAPEVLRALGVTPPDPFRSTPARIGGAHVLVAGTAWGGGSEVYVPRAAATARVWDAIVEAGADVGLAIADPGLASARAAEEGFDDLTAWATPFAITVLEHGGGRFVDREGDGYVGAAAIRAERERGVRRRVGGVVLDDGIELPDPDEGYPPIVVDDTVVGHGLEFHRSLALGRTIGFVLVGADVPIGARAAVGGRPGRLTGRRILRDARRFGG